MTKLFKHMGFEIKCLKNQKTCDLRKNLLDIQKSITVDYDCLVVVISFHGAEIPLSRTLDPKIKLRRHVIYTADDDIPTDEILQVFNDDCPCLKGKPRIFFIQACRCVMGADDEFDVDKGVDIKVTRTKPDSTKYPLIRANRWNHGFSNNDKDKLLVDTKTTEWPSNKYLYQTKNPQNGTSLPDTKGRPEDNNKMSQRELYFQSKEPPSFCYIPFYEDYLVMFSSSSERVAWSNDGKGGWLLYCLYEMFEHLLDSGFKTDLLQVLSDVTGKMARELEASIRSDSLRHRTKSAAIIYHMLTKNICLQPKYR